MEEWVRLLVVSLGYLWGVVVGGVAVALVMRVLHDIQLPLTANGEVQVDPPIGRGWHREGVGVVERSVYVTAIYLQSVEIVFGWVVLKSAAAWHSWQDAPGVFNRYAVGTGLSLAWGASGAGAVVAGLYGLPLFAAAIVISPIALSGLVLLVYWPPLRGLLRLDPHPKAPLREEAGPAADADPET